MMGHQNPYIPPGCTDAGVDRAVAGANPYECSHPRLSPPCPGCGEAATCLTCGVELCPCSDRAGRAGRSEVSKTTPARFESSAPRYVVSIYDRSGTCELNASAASADFPTILTQVRILAKRYHQREYFAITLQNDTQVDENFDGLTDEEREQFEDAVESSRPAAHPVAGVLADTAPGPGAPPHSKRSLREDPALEDIDARIRSLDGMRASLTNADRERWSVLADIQRETEALVSAIRRARRQL